MDQLLRDQQNPSPDFHRWLTPEQYADRFWPERRAITRKIIAWLTSNGFKHK